MSPRMTLVLCCLVTGCGLFSRDETSPNPVGREPASEAREQGSVEAEPEKKPPAGDHPNVLVIVWDTVRADRLTPYGYVRDTTPRLAELAESSVVYERAVSPGMWTIPSHASLFTGLPVSSHGMNADHKWLEDRFDTMAEWFGAHGYGTYLFSANPFVSEDTNLAQGFDKAELPWRKPWRGAARKQTTRKLIPGDASNTLGDAFVRGQIPTGRAADRVKDAGTVTADALFSWLDKRDQPDAPFLAVLNYMEAHVPRIPSKASREALFDQSEIDQQLKTDQSLGRLLAYNVEAVDMSEDELVALGQTYDASLRDLDAVTGELMDRLAAASLLDDTIVVITADHGEHLGEHHRTGHKFSVGNPLVRVPLIIRYPRALPAGRVSQVVSTLHVWATVADLAGFEAPEQSTVGSLRDLEAVPGRAVSELVKATPQALERVRKAYPDFTMDRWLKTYVSVETEQYKCVQSSLSERRLYAMPGDVGEDHDLSTAQPEALAATCGEIKTWAEGLTPFVAQESSKGGSDDASLRERLEMLGYLDGE